MCKSKTLGKGSINPSLYSFGGMNLNCVRPVKKSYGVICSSRKSSVLGLKSAKSIWFIEIRMEKAKLTYRSSFSKQISKSKFCFQ